MNTTLVALVLVIILAVGIYIGVSGFSQQYAVETGRSSAQQILCAPDSAITRVGKFVRYAVGGLPGGTAYHWASDDGRSEILPDGRLQVSYATKGIKTARLFYLLSDRWLMTPCSVTVQ